MIRALKYGLWVLVSFVMLSCSGEDQPTPAATPSDPLQASSSPAKPDTTRPLRQQLTYLESIRSFGDGALLSATRHADPLVRACAVRALGRIQDAEALLTLLPRLNDSDSTVILEAAWALRQLKGLTESQRFKLQSALVQALEVVADEDAWPFLEAMAEHPGPATVEKLGYYTASGITSSQGSAGRPPHSEGLAIKALAALDTEGSKRVRSSLGALTNRVAPATWLIAQALSTPPDSAHFPSLLSLLDHQDKQARAAGARALGRLGMNAAQEKLVRRLSDFDWEVRARVLQALGELDDPASASYCIALAADKHPLVREAAFAALAKLGAKEFLSLVRTALKDAAPAVRLVALEVLAKSGGIEASEAYVAARQDSVSFVRAGALAWLVEIYGTEKGIPLLLDAIRNGEIPERIQALQALGELENHASEIQQALLTKVQEALNESLRHADFVVATLAAESLGKLKMESSADLLMQTYDLRQQTHNDRDIRLAIVPALAQIANQQRSASGDIEKFLNRALADQDPRIAHEAALGLATLKDKTPPEPPAPKAQGYAKPTPQSLPEIDLGRVYVRLRTRHGDAILELEGDDYPRTVSSFLDRIADGFHEDGVFHRVVPAFVVQGGCPRGDGWGDAGYLLPCEYGRLRYDRPGIIGMAHAGKDTGGSQFFITHLPTPRLDGRYTAFGRVIEGMDMVSEIVRGDHYSLQRLPNKP